MGLSNEMRSTSGFSASISNTAFGSSTECAFSTDSFLPTAPPAACTEATSSSGDVPSTARTITRDRPRTREICRLARGPSLFNAAADGEEEDGVEDNVLSSSCPDAIPGRAAIISATAANRANLAFLLIAGTSKTSLALLHRRKEVRHLATVMPRALQHALSQ